MLRCNGTLAAFQLLVTVSLLACSSADTRSALPVRPPSDPDIPALRYDIEVQVAPAQHELSVVGSVQSTRPRTRFYLSELLELDELADEQGPIAHRRTGSRVELERPFTRARFRYHGRLVREGQRDFKSRAWLQPGEVRLTEITLWYPIFYDGESDVPWPPEPATGALSVSKVDGLHWTTSGVSTGPGRFEFREPSDLVLTGVPFAPTSYAGQPTFQIFSARHAALAPTLRSAWDSLARRLGPANTSVINVAEFPATGTTNGLAFLSSNLIVLSSATSNYVVERTPRALRVVSHEMAHRWFGGDLRPTGPGTRWLAESFAEYYAWLVLREQLGDDEYRNAVVETEGQAGTVPTRILALGWDDERVYSAGTLGVRALADLVGQQRLDEAVRHIHDSRSDWSVANLFDQLQASGAQAQELQAFRSEWGLE